MNDYEGEFAIGRDGKPLLDRYGRPVRRRRQAPLPPPVEPTRLDVGRSEPYLPPTVPPARRAARPPARPMVSSAAVPRRRRRRQRPGCGCVTLPLLLVLVLAIVGTLWVDARLNRVEALPTAPVANTAGTNWLLVGSDSRQGLSDADVARLGTGGDIGTGRTDTIMLLHLPSTGTPQLISLPRDSYVAIPGYGMDKLNAAFYYGGPQLLTTTVEQATGLRIDHYAEIGMGGLANTVDAVGGIQVCPSEPLVDPLANLDIPAGCQTLNGPEALGYVRTRNSALGDLDRVARQREFFAALLDKITSVSTLANPFRALPLILEVSGSFSVGKGDHLWHLARVGLAMRGGVTTDTVPIAGFADYDVGSVVLWDDAGAQALFGAMR